jgi:hypothetical protein
MPNNISGLIQNAGLPIVYKVKTSAESDGEKMPVLVTVLGNIHRDNRYDASMGLLKCIVSYFCFVAIERI